MSWIALCATSGVLAGLWALDAAVLRTGLLADAGSRSALTPLYAFWSPLARPTAVLFPACAAVAVLVAPRLADPARTSGRAFGAAVAILGAACALALFLVRMRCESLGANFDVYRGEEFLHDARAVGDASAFLAGYVERMPGLSTHGRHFPPGHALLLHAWGAWFGAGTFPAGVLVWLCAAAALPIVLLGLRELLEERAARQATLLVAIAPAFLDFACTAMDAVFLLVASIAWWLGLRAFGPHGRARDAAFAGLALLAASFFSFSALPLGLALTAYGVLGRRSASGLPLAVAGAAFFAGALALRAGTGFALWDCFLAAHEHAQAFMERVRAEHPRTELWRIVPGNAVAFAVGAGVALIAASGARLARAGLPRDAWTRAALAALLVMCALYRLETERIWLFAVPWLAAIALARGPLEDEDLRRLVAVAALQAFLLEVALFTLW